MAKRNSFTYGMILSAALLLSGCGHLPAWMGGDEATKPKLPGTRVSVLPTESIPVDSGLGAVHVTVPPAVTNAQWPQHMGTPRASIGNLTVAEHFSEKLSQRAGEGNKWGEPLVITPVVGGDTLFAMDAIGAVSAHDAKAITSVRWVSRAVVGKDEDDILGGGLAYDAGRLYVSTGRGVLAALDVQTGQSIWKQNVGLPFRSAPKIDDGKLFAVSVDNQIFALDPATGAVLWNSRGIDETSSYLNAVSPAAAGGLVVAPYSSGEIHVLKAADGTELWTDTLILPKRTLATSVFSGIGADPVIEGGVMYAVGSGGMMAAFNLGTGQRLWDQSISSVNTPWLAGEFLYVMTVDNHLACLRRSDGRIKWAVQLPSFGDEEKRQEPRVWSGPVMASGRLLVVGAHGEMLVLSPADGSMIETQPIPEGVYGAPIIAEGRLYLIDRDAELHIFY